MQFTPILFMINYIWKKEKFSEKWENKLPTGNKMRLTFTYDEQWMPEKNQAMTFKVQRENNLQLIILNPTITQTWGENRHQKKQFICWVLSLLRSYLKIGKLWYIYTMEYYSAIKKNSFESVLMRWMKLEPIIQNEVSQKDKDHYSILTHIYGI